MMSRRALHAGLLLAVLFFIYFQGARYHAMHVNIDESRGDQRAYLNTTEKMVETKLRYTGDRNRMPLYHYFLLPAYRSGSSLQAFFDRAKILNIVYSMFLLVGIFFVLRGVLSFWDAMNLILITAFTLFIFRSGYVQCEVLFYSLSFTAFYGMVRMFLAPTWKKAVLTGVLLGLAHLTKASVLPALGLFSLFFLFQKKRLMLAAVLVSFVIVVFPYIHESKEKFGHYFYNVNSTFYMWTDSWEEAKRLTRAHGDRLGWPQMPADEIPGPRKYIREHSLKEMGLRVWNGLKRLQGEIAVSYGYQYFMLLYAFWFFVACVRPFRSRIGWVRDHMALSGFVSCYLLSYLVLCAWYVPINGGPRQLLMLFLPFMFTALVGIDKSKFFHGSVVALYLFMGGFVTERLMNFYAGN